LYVQEGKNHTCPKYDMRYEIRKGERSAMMKNIKRKDEKIKSPRTEKSPRKLSLHKFFFPNK